MPDPGQAPEPSASPPAEIAAVQTSVPFWPLDATPLPSFLETAYKLDIADFEILTDQAIVLLEQLYVHLPMKRAARGIDPAQRLRLLKHKLPRLSQRQFHDEMISIFGTLHDMHTHFSLPAPFAGKSALLPFVVEEYLDKSSKPAVRRFVVSKVVTSFEDETFKPGVRVTHWNGVPIDRAVEVNGTRQLGANPEAERARGLLTLTIRPLTRTAAPDEMWVDVDYLAADGTPQRRRFDWVVAKSPPGAFTLIASASEGDEPVPIGVDYDLEIISQFRKQLYSSSATEPQPAGATPTFTPTGAFKFYPVPTPKGPFGYVRIWTFDVKRQDDFIEEFKHIITHLPQDGLILDVRGNGGGALRLAEGILQFLTPVQIEPGRYQLLCTPLTLRATKFNTTYAAWADSISGAADIGAQFSASLPLTTIDAANNVGQLYQGPVVLITDALCYSATDTFAAAFQDHDIGPILGVHRTTGAGGATVWEYSDVLQFLAGPDVNISALPKNSKFRVAFARNTRVKKQSNVLIEEFGVTADVTHDMTQNDVMNTTNPNEDLIKRAITLLEGKPRYSLSGTAVRQPNGDLVVTATWSGLDRINAFVDGQPSIGLKVTSSPTTFTLAGVPTGEHRIALSGFSGSKRAAFTALASE